MRTKYLLFALLALPIIGHPLSRAYAQSTTFSYQGRLNGLGSPAVGSYDFCFRLASDALAQNYVGQPFVTNAVPVNEGLFTVTLDFGTGIFTGPDYWLEVGVRTNSASSFTQLLPRQAVTSTPYAMMAGSASNLLGSLPAAQLSGVIQASQLTGTVSLAQLPGVLVTNGEAGISLSGTLAGNGAGVTNLNLLTANSYGAMKWVYKANFIVASSPGVGNAPGSVAAADVNDDGQVDLISANSSSGTLTVLTNNSCGGFGLNATLSVGSSLMCVAAADVNGDGRVDLIAAISPVGAQQGSLKVLTNNGSGGFSLSASPTLATPPTYVVAADVNGDGEPDLISANFSLLTQQSTVTLITNNGSGGFGLNATLPVGARPYSVAAADVNADGKVDLMTANTTDNTLTLLTNNGSGGFGLNATLSVGNRPYSPMAADINGDGKLDLINANLNDNTLTVLTNDGSGGFGLNATLSVGGGPYSVVAADVNNDGIPDLINPNYSDNTLTVLTNNGSGDFGLNATLPVGTRPKCVVAADLNGDGKPDLISANSTANTLTVLLNTPSLQGSFIGNGAGLTGLNAANLTGIAGGFSVTNLAVLGSIVGDGSGLTNLNAASLTGTAGSLSVTNLIVHGAIAGDGSGLTNLNLPADLAFLDVDQAFTGRTTFSNLVEMRTNMLMNDMDIQFRNDAFHGVGYYGPGKSFAGFNPNGPVMYGYAGGGLGVRQPGTTNIALSWNGSGNVGIGTTSMPYPLTMGGGAYCTGAQWQNACDRDLKENFQLVDTRAILQKVATLPIATWNYRTENAAVKHLGPTAQDFQAAFQLGDNNKSIGTVDEAGVALAAIQGLNLKLEETRAENAELKARLTKLERLLNERNEGGQGIQ